ncbi:MAG: photosystem reaction center subunit [Geminicoccaceae bacterium]|nr:photosystem reaction center subunit [Geminicoccaceae bacterium]
MAMQDSQSVATDETSTLISSDKVEGTAVYNREGEKLGSIHTLMIDKMSGKVAYAVMSFGVVDLDRSKLEGAPTYGTAETPNWSDRRWGQQVHDYYGTRPYWE